jgi:hypothetical protein
MEGKPVTGHAIVELVGDCGMPYGFAPKNIIPLVDRKIYPEAEFPAGQWDYMLFSEENFDKARAGFEGNIANTVKALFRAGSPEGKCRPNSKSLLPLKLAHDFPFRAVVSPKARPARQGHQRRPP